MARLLAHGDHRHDLVRRGIETYELALTLARGPDRVVACGDALRMRRHIDARQHGGCLWVNSNDLVRLVGRDPDRSCSDGNADCSEPDSDMADHLAVSRVDARKHAVPVGRGPDGAVGLGKAEHSATHGERRRQRRRGGGRERHGRRSGRRRKRRRGRLCRCLRSVSRRSARRRFCLAGARGAGDDHDVDGEQAQQARARGPHNAGGL